MKLLYSGFNGFHQWPLEEYATNDFQLTSVEKYLKFSDKIQSIDVGIEWAYNAFIINSTVYIKGFTGEVEGEIEILRNPNDDPITNISCNDRHILMYNKEDKYIWKYHLDPSIQDRWRLLPNFLNSEHGPEDDMERIDETISKVVCGYMMNICLTSEGRLFNIPTEISLHDVQGKIIDVCCGYEHVVILTDMGLVYTFGGGSRCQLGHGSIDSLQRLSVIEGLMGIEIVKIAAGGWHSCAVSCIGDLYTWGWNDKGQLGINSRKISNYRDSDCFEESHDAIWGKQQECDDSNDKPSSPKRKRSESFTNKIISDKYQMEFNSYAIPNLIDIFDSSDGKILELNVVDVSCGSKHTVIKLDDGSVWGSGCNKFGQLGFSSSEVDSVKHFTMLNIDAKDSVVKCGIWSTALLTAIEDDDAQSILENESISELSS